MPSLHSPQKPGRKYEIFRDDPGSGPLWIETVVGLDEAKLRVAKLYADAPANYRVFDVLAGVFLEFRTGKSA